MVLNRNVTSFKRLLRRSHCPDRRLLVGFVKGQDDREAERLAELANLSQADPAYDIIAMINQHPIIC